MIRYLFAIAVAAGVAFLATVFVANDVASWVVGRMSFSSPDQVSDLHSALYMGVGLIGLVVGWMIGFPLGALFDKPDPDETEA
jgi:hypothetical protein